ncbi:MAG: sigma-70 family RNA polymerase sigma factor [Prevotella sp.]|nr:sigma-70 family RNA polymerase sigma factor [Prevotella sp.]
MTESEVLKKLITDFYSQHAGEVKAFVAKRLGYSSESEDLVQNIFLKLLESDKMISPVTLPCLVYTIARNMISDYWRHHSSVNEYEHYIKTTVGIYPERTEVRSVYSAVELNDILERGIARLTDRQRHIYRMNVIEGMQVSEISECLQENYKSVENRLGAARKVVRQYVRKMLA